MGIKAKYQCALKNPELAVRKNKEEKFMTTNTTSPPGEGVYTDTTVRLFSLAAVLWGVVGMSVGVLIA